MGSEQWLVAIELKSGGTPLSVKENNTVCLLFLLTNVVKPLSPFSLPSLDSVFSEGRVEGRY